MAMSLFWKDFVNTSSSTLTGHLAEKGAIGDTTYDPGGHNTVHHDPSNPDPTPGGRKNGKGMNNSHTDRRSRPVEAFQLPAERQSVGGEAIQGAK